MIIVAFAGLARGGKTTAANHLAKWCLDHDLKPIICSFAASLKNAAKRAGIDKEKHPELYRKTLQRWGESRRDPKYRPGRTGPDFWVSRTAVELLYCTVDEKEYYRQLTCLGAEQHFRERVLIFDDMRYENEVELIQSLGGTTVFIDGHCRIKDKDAEWRKHESEKMATDYTYGDLDDGLFDYIAMNNGSEKSFKGLVETLAPVWLDMEILT